MFLFKSISALQRHLDDVKGMSKTVGFVPTMGALHEGHGSLITHALGKGNYTVVSIYVNPTQFNDAADLEKYPRPVSSDLEKLFELGVNVVFLPSDPEMYPKGNSFIPDLSLGHLGDTLEAAYRPGHFEGVVQVMHRLIGIVDPDVLYMGLKDLQQVAVVRKLIEESRFSCELVGLPIIREPNGLARSSRNERLSDDDRRQAAIIFETLKDTLRNYHDLSYQELKLAALDRLNRQPFRPEYFEFVQTDSLEILPTKPEGKKSVSAVTAVWCGDVRLIDNMEMPSES